MIVYAIGAVLFLVAAFFLAICYILFDLIFYWSFILIFAVFLYLL